MNKLLLTSSFLLLVELCSAQSDNLIDSNLNTASEVKYKTEKTLVINTTNYDQLTFESLKDELISWKEKVKSAEINEASHQFTLIHFSLLENRELFDVLKKYNIEKNAIISYK